MTEEKTEKTKAEAEKIAARIVNQNAGSKNFELRIEKLKKHVEKHKHDYKTKRALLIKQVKLRKLDSYESKRKLVK